MSVSKLATRSVPYYHKYRNRHGRPVTRVIQHHWAGTGGGVEHLSNKNVAASCHYFVLSDGTIISQVPEHLAAWTSGSWEADSSAITIEVQNSAGRASGAGDLDPRSWPISDKAMASLISLIRDIATRHRFGKLTTGNYIGHYQVQSTSCPGGYLRSKMGYIREQVNGGKTVQKQSARVDASKTDWVLADEVLAGVHGTGEARKRSLGSRYQAVQSLVNKRLGVTTPSKKAAPKKTSTAKPSKSISQLADEVMAGAHGNGDARKRSLGKNYAAVQKEVNRRLGAGSSKKSPNIAQLANDVLRGKYGNGEARKKALGKNYAAVQREVNRRLGL